MEEARKNAIQHVSNTQYTVYSVMCLLYYHFVIDHYHLNVIFLASSRDNKKENRRNPR